MILGINFNWVKTPLFHQAVRIRSVQGKDNQKGYLDFDKYLTSHDDLLNSLTKIRNTSFEVNYRRRSQDLDIKLDNSLRVLAYANPEFKGTAFISRGLLIAIEDASQSIVSDSRSKFALNSPNLQIDENVMAPDVAWLPAYSKVFDPYRYVDYELMFEVAKKSPKFPVGLFHKFVSASSFRQQLGDLLSLFSVLWVSGHEDAHFFLGHMEYFNKKFGAYSQESGSYFDEFIGRYTKLENKNYRLAAEIQADIMACNILVDHVCWDEMFEINPFLQQHSSYKKNASLGDQESLKKAKTLYLFRLCVISATISIAIFERNTIKNNLDTAFYPTLSTRILNMVQEISGRIISVSRHHPLRGFYHLSLDDWFEAFQQIQEDIEIVLLYIFEQGFVLQDEDIGIRTVEEVLDFKLDKELFANFSIFLKLLVTIPENFLSSHADQDKAKIKAFSSQFTQKDKMINYFSTLVKCREITAKEFLPSRLKVNKDNVEKVKESVEEEIKGASNLKSLIEMLS